MEENRVLFCLKYRHKKYDDIVSWGDQPLLDINGRKVFSSGLYNSANFMNEMLQKNGVVSTLRHVEDFNKIHAEIVKFKATHVIIEAFWVVPDKFIELNRVCPKVKFFIRNHSAAPFLSQEGIGFDWTLRYIGKPNTTMTCNDPRMLEETRFLAQELFPEWNKAQINDHVKYLPNYYPIPDVIPSHPINPNADTIRIGCFGAIRPLKNQILQAIAAIKFAKSINKKMTFHINSSRVEMDGGPILNNLRGIFSKYEEQYQLIEEPYLEHEAFKKLMSTMDILTQCSLSETFNIVAADAVTQGVPIVSSSEIPWDHWLFRANPSDSNSIAHAMNIAYNVKLKFPNYNPALKNLRKYNTNSEKIWLDVFK